MPRGLPGAAIFDFDNDGDLDLYVTNAPGHANALLANQLHQTGQLTFIDVAAQAGVAAVEHDSYGVCFGDLDNDGDGLVHHHLARTAAYPFVHADVLQSEAVAEVVARFGTALLPMAYPEGCPTHPAYPSGHAAIAGACVTVLKAFFHEGAVVPRPVEASPDGLTLHPYAGPALTVGDELHKLAANIALGRDTAGVHWRSDGIEGLRLGEAVAIGLLTDLEMTYHEASGGLSLTTFDGATITIPSSV